MAQSINDDFNKILLTVSPNSDCNKLFSSPKQEKELMSSPKTNIGKRM
jgi:hypothetical protein